MCEAQSFRQHKRKKQETKVTFEYIYRFMLGAGQGYESPWQACP